MANPNASASAHGFNWSRTTRLAARLSLREWRSGSLYLLLWALIIAVASHTTLGFFTERLERSMVHRAGQIMGGDLIVKGPEPLPELFLSPAQDTTQPPNLSAPLTTVRLVEFSTVLIFDEDIQLSAVKAVSEHYPLSGSLRIATEIGDTGQEVKQPPPPGEVWVEQRLLSLLNVSVGDTVTIGEAPLKITQILLDEPDRGGSFYNIAPRVMMNLQDLATTQVIQPGSRVTYRYYFQGAEADLNQYREWLKPRLNPNQRFAGIESERPSLNTALERAQKYMSLSGLVAILLAAVAIAMGARYYAHKHFDSSALLRCIGVKQNELLGIYLLQLAALALLATVIGSAIGYALQEIIRWILSSALPKHFPGPTLMPVVTGCALSFAVLFGFSLPTLIQLRRVSPLRVLRKDLLPAPLSVRVLYAFTGVLILTIIFSYTRDVWLSAAAFFGAFVILLLGYVVVSLLYRVLNRSTRVAPPMVKAGLRNLLRRSAETRWQTLAFALTLMAMTMIAVLRIELIERWQDQLPEQAPNHFVMNVLPEKTAGFQAFLDTHNINSNQLYPISRGRLAYINDQPVKAAVTKEAADSGALNRELSLTQAAALSPDNRVIQGAWWGDNPQHGQVSVENRLAERLNIKVGDTLRFTVGAQQLTAQVTSTRSVKWDSFNPNFYMIFSPGSFAQLPVTYITSFYLPPDQNRVVKDLVTQFPGITLVDVDGILAEVRNVLTQATLAIELVLVLVLLAGLTVTYAALQSSLSDRIHEGALLRTLGASKKQLQRNQRFEFMALGVVSGLLACAGTETILWVLYTQLFNFEFTPHWFLWLLLPLMGGALIGLFGFISSRHVVAESPLRLLREI